jgi:hypothetical protein
MLDTSHMFLENFRILFENKEVKNRENVSGLFILLGENRDVRKPFKRT